MPLASCLLKCLIPPAFLNLKITQKNTQKPPKKSKNRSKNQKIVKNRSSQSKPRRKPPPQTQLYHRNNAPNRHIHTPNPPPTAPKHSFYPPKIPNRADFAPCKLRIKENPPPEKPVLSRPRAPKVTLALTKIKTYSNTLPTKQALTSPNHRVFALLDQRNFADKNKHLRLRFTGIIIS